MKAEYEMKFEQKMGKLENLNPALKQMLFDAFVLILKKEKRDKIIAKKYAYPLTGKTSAGIYGAMFQDNECRKKDQKHYQHPVTKMNRYLSDKASHDGLLPGIVCSCYNPNTAAVPCPYDMGRPDRIGMPPKNKTAHLVVSGNRLLNKLESPVLKLLKQYEEEEQYNDE